jgi:hypothetical protein
VCASGAGAGEQRQQQCCKTGQLLAKREGAMRPDSGAGSSIGASGIVAILNIRYFGEYVYASKPSPIFYVPALELPLRSLIYNIILLKLLGF